MQTVRQDQVKWQKLEYLLNDVNYLYNDYWIVYLWTTKFYNKDFFDLSVNVNSDVWNSVDFYPYIYEAYFGLYDAKNNKVYWDLQFSDLNEVKNYITNLWIQNSKKSFLFHYYKKQKYLGALNVFWYNTFYSMIIDKWMTMKSWSLNHLTWDVEWSWFNNFVETIVKNVVWYSWYTASLWDRWPSNIWIPKNKHKMYWWFLWINIGIEQSTSRYKYNWTEFVLADWTRELDTSWWYIMWMNTSQNFWRIWLADTRLFFTKFRKENTYQSFIRVYKVRQSAWWSYDYAAYVKPIWVDTLQVEWYDTTKYELLLVYRKKNKVIKIKTLTPDEDYTTIKWRFRFFGNKWRNMKIWWTKDRDLEKRIEIYLKEKWTWNIVAMSNKVLKPISFRYNPMWYVLEHV